MMQRLHAEFRDLVELVLLPSLAACLPWKVAFRLFRAAAQWEWLYAEATERAQQHAKALGIPGAESSAWAQQRRLITLVDHADHYLGLTRANTWIGKHIKVTGSWPDSRGPLALITFHWGAGYWGLRHAAVHGLQPHALMASLDSSAYQSRSVLFRYARSRNRNVERVLRAQPIDVSHDLRRLVRTLRGGEPVLGVVDVPADGQDPSSVVSVQLLGRPALFHGGLLRRIAEHRIPVVLYITGLETVTGDRTLSIEAIPNSGDVTELTTLTFDRLNALLAQSSAAWHFWSEAPRIFRINPATASESA